MSLSSMSVASLHHQTCRQTKIKDTSRNLLFAFDWQLSPCASFSWLTRRSSFIIGPQILQITDRRGQSLSQSSVSHRSHVTSASRHVASRCQRVTHSRLLTTANWTLECQCCREQAESARCSGIPGVMSRRLIAHLSNCDAKNDHFSLRGIVRFCCCKLCKVGKSTTRHTT